MASKKNSAMELLKAASTLPSSSSKIPLAKDLKALSFSAKDRPTSSARGEGIQFGTAPQSALKSPTSTASILPGLASSFLSGGISSLLGGGGLLSDLAGFFTGSSKSAPPALPAFSLPTSEEQTVYVSASSKTMSVLQGTDVESAAPGSKPLPAVSAAASPAKPLDAAGVVQAVKNAMLTSSSINDIIADV